VCCSIHFLLIVVCMFPYISQDSRHATVCLVVLSERAVKVSRYIAVTVIQQDGGDNKELSVQYFLNTEVKDIASSLYKEPINLFTYFVNIDLICYFSLESTNRLDEVQRIKNHREKLYGILYFSSITQN
jgi:hypothetical protein